MVTRHVLEIYNPSPELEELAHGIAKTCLGMAYQSLYNAAQDVDFVELTKEGKPVAVFVAWDKYKNDNEAE